MKRFERLLALVPWLKAHPYATVDEVAIAFGISSKEVEEDIAQLTLTGYGQSHGELFDIHYDKSGISVIDSLGIDRPIQFDTAEIGCLLVGIETLLSSGIALDVPIEAIRSAQEKISKIIDSPGVIRYLSGAIVDNEDTVTLIQDAISTKKRLSLTYWNHVRDDANQREISPLRIRGTDAYTIVDSYCHTSGGWRSFRVDHIVDIKLLDVDCDVNEEDFIDMQYVIVEVDLPISRAEVLEELVVLKRDTKENTIRAFIQIVTPATLARSVRASGGKLRIIEPAEIAQAVTALNYEALAAYSE